MAYRVLLDTSFLSALVDEHAPARPRPEGLSGTVKQRLDFLWLSLEKAQSEIIIPAPALAEVLCRRDIENTNVLEVLGSSHRIRITSFDERVAVEFGEMFRERRGRQPPSTGGKVKFKFDLMILAMARIEGASVIYTDDDDLRAKSIATGIHAEGFWQLDLPPQQSLPV
ncbi:type II toxin-antitoxin system VapC family toxin [Rhizosaccharibacter radicis]|uniref:PIN domain-containing protein n=1 Tax=Rhizosaccharibacter radicis TaxID=2782605 RepID=A0ABT1VW46_9PROT|nr:PIN domain-containing protein [Acetobacteraceae bacterium KSS12]